MITPKDNLFNYHCILTTPEGNHYNLDHEWHPYRTIFGIITQYKCAQCQKQLSRKEFQDGNYVLFKDVKTYEQP